MTKAACKACRSNDVTPLRPIVRVYTGAPYVLFQCQACGSRFFNLDEHPIELEAFYNARAAEQPMSSMEHRVLPHWRHEVKTLCGWFGGLPRCVLDVGCRTGDLLLHWPSEVERCGVELSEPSAAIAQARGLHVIQQFLEKVEFPHPFDVVSCYAILEHLSEPRAFLETLARLVCENGILAILVPSHETLKAKILEVLGVRWHMYCPPEHLVFYTRRFLDEFFTSRGFALIRRRYTSGGMFNPFTDLPVVGGAWSRMMWLLDAHSYENRLPLFDHMYSYYRRQTPQSQRTRTPRAA